MNQNEPEHALVPVETAMKFPSDDRMDELNAHIQRMRKRVHTHLEPGVDFGPIEGTGDKPSLHKTGAEKIAQLFGTRPDMHIIQIDEDWDKGLFAYIVRCDLIHVESGQIYAQGLGECNSYEPKYRYRAAQRICPNCGQDKIIKGKTEYGGGWLCWRSKGGCGEHWDDLDEQAKTFEAMKLDPVENPDRAGQRNTYIKMAKIRSLRDAALGLGALSAIFTQDIEDEPDPAVSGKAAARVEPKRAVSQAECPDCKPAEGSMGPDGKPEYYEPPELCSKHDGSERSNGTGEPPSDPSQFRHVGDFMNAAMSHLGVYRDDALAILGVKEPKDISDLQAAWDQLVAERDGANAQMPV